MVLFLNMTESIGIVLGNATTYTTGSMFLTLLIVMLIIIAIAIMFGIQLEYTMILLLPLLISYMAFYGEFVTIGSVILIYLAFVFTKKFILR